MVAETSNPASMPTKPAYRVSSGTISIRASMRGSTRKSTGEMPEGLEGVDLLVDLHGAELGGERRAGAAGDDDPGHQRAHLAHHADGHQIGDEDLRPDQAELIGAQIGEDEADEKADHRDDEQGARPDLLDLQPEIAQAEPGAPADQPPKERVISPRKRSISGAP